jgi:hypothetical protein
MNGKIDDFRNGEETDRDGHQANTIPEIELIKRKTLDTGDWIQSHRRKHKPDAPGDDAFQYRFATQSGHEGNAEESQHEKLGRSE